jgi:transcriptional regulator with XRE-family HTH domain
MARLEELRRGRPLTQAELAAAADVSEATIRSIENGYAGRLRPRTMRAIAAALAAELADIDEFHPSLGINGPTKKPRRR